MVFEGRICWYLKKDLFVFDEGFVGIWRKGDCCVLSDDISWTNNQYPDINAQNNFSWRQNIWPLPKNAPEMRKQTFSDVSMLDENPYLKIRFALDTSWHWFYLLSEIVPVKRCWQKGMKDNPIPLLLHFRVFVN